MKDLHKPERGHVALSEEEREQLEDAGNPSMVDYARREGLFLVTYWRAPVRSEPGISLDLSVCVATWIRADAEGDR